MSTKSRCARDTPQRGDVLRRRTDDSDRDGSDDSDDSVNEAVAAAAAALAADRAWHKSKDIPFVEVSATFPMGAGDSACEFQRTDSRAAQCCACGKGFGVHSYNGRTLNMHAAACAREQLLLNQRAARGVIGGVEWIGSDDSAK